MMSGRWFKGIVSGLALGLSLATVKRDWTFARAWLQRTLSATG